MVIVGKKLKFCKSIVLIRRKKKEVEMSEQALREVIGIQNKEIRELKTKIRNMEEWREMKEAEGKARRHQRIWEEKE